MLPNVMVWAINATTGAARFPLSTSIDNTWIRNLHIFRLESNRHLPNLKCLTESPPSPKLHRKAIQDSHFPPGPLQWTHEGTSLLLQTFWGAVLPGCTLEWTAAFVGDRAEVTFGGSAGRCNLPNGYYENDILNAKFTHLIYRPYTPATQVST